MVVDDGAIVYLNGTEIIRDNMPAGTVLFDEYASGNSADQNYNAFTVPLGDLVEGINEIGVEIHQTNKTSSDIAFDMDFKTEQPA